MNEERSDSPQDDSLSRYSLIRKCLEDVLEANQQSSVIERTVTWQEYMTVVSELQAERAAHKETKLQLVGVQDQLSFALGEIEILRKQIEREKAQFELTITSLRKRFTDGGHISATPEDGSGGQWMCPNDSSTAAAAGNQLAFRDQLSELNVQMQQDLYISKLLGKTSESTVSSGRRTAACDSSTSSVKSRRHRQNATGDAVYSTGASASLRTSSGIVAAGRKRL